MFLNAPRNKFVLSYYIAPKRITSVLSMRILVTRSNSPSQNYMLRLSRLVPIMATPKDIRYQFKSGKLASLLIKENKCLKRPRKILFRPDSNDEVLIMRSTRQHDPLHAVSLPLPASALNMAASVCH